MLPLHTHRHPLLYLEAIHTDEDAEPWLPPIPLFRAGYVSLRDAGMTPRESLTETMVGWREMQQSARPSTYGQAKSDEV